MYAWTVKAAECHADPAVMYTYNDVGATVEVARWLVGDKVWKAIYLADADLVPSGFPIPHLLRQLVHVALEREEQACPDERPDWGGKRGGRAHRYGWQRAGEPARTACAG